jgi:hypothetical protein
LSDGGSADEEKKSNQVADDFIGDIPNHVLPWPACRPHNAVHPLQPQHHAPRFMKME